MPPSFFSFSPPPLPVILLSTFATLTTVALSLLTSSPKASPSPRPTLLNLLLNLLLPPRYLQISPTILNSPPSPSSSLPPPPSTTWLTLGLWTSSPPTYAAACSALCTLLSSSAVLADDDRVIDVGCGRGDSSVQFRDRDGVEAVVGVNVDGEEVEDGEREIKGGGIDVDLYFLFPSFLLQSCFSLFSLCLFF